MIWMVPSLFFSGIVLLIDYIARRKKWKENTKTEKTGIVLTVLFSFPYIFGSFFGFFFGIENYDPSPIEAIIIFGGAGISMRTPPRNDSWTAEVRHPNRLKQTPLPLARQLKKLAWRPA